MRTKTRSAAEAGFVSAGGAAKIVTIGRIEKRQAPIRLRNGLRTGLTLLVMSLGLGLVVVRPATAKPVSNTFGGLSRDTGKPIDIEADALTVYDAKHYATFTGNVKAVQGTTTLRSNTLEVHYKANGSLLSGGGESASNGKHHAPAGAKKDYAGKEASKGASPQTQITSIDAKGNVIITSGNDQTTTSDWAHYDVPAQLVTVGGNVVLTQGKNVLKGNKLVINLKTGESRFVNTGDKATGNRIRALFMPAENHQKAKKKKGAEPKKGSQSDKSGAGSSTGGWTTEDHAAAAPRQLVPKGHE